MEKRKFYYCPHCGNLLGVLNDSGVVSVCCGDPMKNIQPNSTDASNEKHVPAVTRNGKKVEVQVGSVAHPMEDAHYIQWILVQQGNHVQRIILKPGQEPKAEFEVKSDSDPIAVYEYCNLHGLWIAEA